MTSARRRVVWIGAGLGLLAAAAAVGTTRWEAAPSTTAQVDSPACSSCTARHQRLTRLVAIPEEEK